MPPVTPTGMLSAPIANLRTALSNVTAFQTWVGAVDAAAALAFIGIVERAASTGNFAVIDDGDQFDVEMLDSGAGFSDEGNLLLLFQGDVDEDDAASEESAQLTFTNAVGGILEALIAYCGNNRNVFSIARVSKMFGPARAGDTERQNGVDYEQIGFLVGWR